jgi:hypothetical protein
MVRPDELAQGRFYILLIPGTTAEEKPSVKTCFYIGRNLSKGEDGGEHWYFQGTKSFLERQGLEPISEETEKDLYTLDEASLARVHDFPGLVDRAIAWERNPQLSLSAPAG